MGDSRALPASASRAIVRYDCGALTTIEDVVATEYALTIYVNDEELATVVCTPHNMEELVVGFLASEGVISRMEQIRDIQISSFRGTARVQTTHTMTFNQAFYNKRYIASCCGKGRQSFYFHNDAMTAKRVEDNVQIEPMQVFQLLDEMDNEATLHHETGGVHIAALCTSAELKLSRTDIGRHNALDKIYGHCLQSGLNVQGKIICFSGRISSEVLLKVAKIGIGMVISRSAPTELALSMAEELGITVIGFARAHKFNVYTYPERIRS